ncbi:right-handed parallel beta-helix repeat-containing protein [Allorhodopirellula solitaria]|nr:right-handed parallel beta-helix repeat-containing protein [Allorhodopirellula solitaria]
MLTAESLETRALLTTFYVAGGAGGNVPGDGSIHSPFMTINAGVAAAMQNSEADEIVIASHANGAAYHETVTFLDKGADRSAITIRGASGDRADVVLTPFSGPGIFADAPIELTIADLSVDNPYSAGIRVIDGDVTVENVHVTGSMTNSGIVHQQGDLTVRDSLLENNYQGLWSAELRDDFNNQIGLPGDLTVENTVTRNNNAQGIYMRNATGAVTLRDVDSYENRLNGFVAFNEQSLRIEGGNFHDNGESGAAVVESSGVAIVDAEFTDNDHSGVWTRASDSLNFEGGLFEGNTRRGLFLVDSAAASISNVTVSGNAYGGIHIEGADGVSIDQAIVTGNGDIVDNISIGGGGIHIQPSTAAPIAISNSRVNDNATRGNGGGIEVWAYNYSVNSNFLTNVTISDTEVTGNQIAPDVARNGGGIALFGPIDAILEDVEVRGNTARGTAGLHAFTAFPSIDGFGSMSVSDSTIADNVAWREGPGIGAGSAGVFHGGGDIHMKGTTISGNDGGNAGGVYLRSLSGDITNTTISGNNGDLTGGLVSNVGHSPLVLRHVTIVDNYGGNTGGITSLTPQLQVGNSVVARNTSGVVNEGPNAVPPQNMSGWLTSLGGNFFAEAVGATIAGNQTDQVGTRDQPLDPLLGSLEDNGGPTLTHAPLPSSPLVDAGNANVTDTLAEDQRGADRIQGAGVDIGAVEQTVYVAETEPLKNRLNLNSADKGNKSVSLVLHSTDDLDATLVDVSTIVWASTVVTKDSLRDVDGDGDLDLILEFRLRETDLVDRYRDALIDDPDNNEQTVAVPLAAKTIGGARVQSSADVDLVMTGKALREILQSI